MMSVYWLNNLSARENDRVKTTVGFAMKKLFPNIQKLGRSLMLPIAVLPVAGLLLRLGQPDLLNLPYVAAAGNAVFANLGLIFAVGVAIGFARDSHGAAGVAAVVSYLVTTEGAKILIAVPPEVVGDAAGHVAELLSSDYTAAAIAKMSVPIGLLAGILSGYLYNRFSEIRLPDYLAFFAGRRFVPIISGFTALLTAAMFGLGWPILENGMNNLSAAVVGSGEVGLFGYGLLNRVLIVTGLHHILNNLAWFLLGDFNGVTGDLRRFFADDPTAGAFMSGFFPVMMFGLPAACLAMYRSATSKRRKAVGGLLLSMALTSFLTGITEPIEFTFMFLAPVLYAVHAILTGISMVLMDLAGIRLGFGFSAGLFDYILNFNRATRPLMMLPNGVIYFFLYYAIFKYFIVRFDIGTPGREATDANGPQKFQAPRDETVAMIDALGGAGNLQEVDACTTRLRLRIASFDLVNQSALKSLGVAGVINPTPETLQVVVGPRADQIATNIRHCLDDPGRLSTTAPPATSPNLLAGIPEVEESEGLLQALGGKGNVRDIEAVGTRLCMTLKDTALVDELQLLSNGFRGIAQLSGNRIQLLVNSDATEVEIGLQRLL